MTIGETAEAVTIYAIEVRIRTTINEDICFNESHIMLKDFFMNSTDLPFIDMNQFSFLKSMHINVSIIKKNNTIPIHQKRFAIEKGMYNPMLYENEYLLACERLVRKE